MISWQWCLAPSCLKDLLSIGTSSNASFIFTLRGVTVFISNCVETESLFLGTPGTSNEPAFRQRVVFFRLRPGKVMFSRFSFCNSFPREASDDLTQPMKVNALEGALVESLSNRFPSPTTAHQCAQMSVSASTYAVEAIKSLAPGLPGVLRRSSW